MKEKKGFAFIETIVTIVVLSVSLLAIYSNFSNVLIKEKRRVNYDDVAYVYRAFYLKNFFADYELKGALKTLNEDNPITIIGCDYNNMFAGNSGAKEVCDRLYANLSIEKAAVALNDFSYVKNCNAYISCVADCSNSSCKDTCNTKYGTYSGENMNKCYYLKNFSDDEWMYFETLGKLDSKNKYIMIVEFKKDDKYDGLVEKNPDSLTNNYYAWVRI